MATFSPPGAGTSITADKLNDSNYILWSKGVEFYLIAQGKVSATTRKVLANPGWRVVMEEQMKALCDRGTWELQALPNGKEVVGCRWVVTIKYQPDGSVEWLKA
ncbi:hypothetical protein CK203_081701 [Vitis vinifera]|uniref:Retrotransposon Copia-like N-terminal domain-containing protein n=1 Tax=Vitis vinifera TaxID=29760 RepID=A0A438DPS5_VITVI|nr:hypothetical protein CK203_081701 [Vitis vinifera]